MGLLDKTAPGKSKRTAESNSTQSHLRMGEIHDNVLVLKNGGLRAILKVSSINFNLKSEQEQTAIIQGYQGFLNSLEFPIQITVRSKKLDIDDYIDQVQELSEKQTNPLLKEQTVEYAEYIKKLVEYADIMEKEFYVVVPYDPGRSAGTSNGGLQSFFQRLSSKDSSTDFKKRQSEFDNLKKSLLQRVNVVKAGLENCGLQATQLNTEGIIQLLYGIYNPKTSRTVKLKDLANTELDTDEQPEK